MRMTFELSPLAQSVLIAIFSSIILFAVIISTTNSTASNFLQFFIGKNNFFHVHYLCFVYNLFLQM